MYGDNKDNQDKKEVGDVLFDWKRRFDNFMYHYKFVILAVLAAAAILLFALVQCAAKAESDAHIAYAGTKSFDVLEMDKIEEAFGKILGEDLNGDGKIYNQLSHFLYMTDAQIEDARAEGRIIDVGSVRIARTQLSLELSGTKNIIYFLSPDAYRAIRRSGEINNFMYIEDALGYAPGDILYDEFAVRLNKLQCYEYFDGIYDFPEDTLIAVRDLRAEDNKNKKLTEKYENNLLMFKRIVEFKYMD
jgi:hypothetical protein